MRRASATLLLGGLLLLAFARPVLGQTIELPRDVPSFNQAYTDGPNAWGDCRLGTDGCPDRISDTGCLTTAFASVLAYYGVELDIAAADSCTHRARRGIDPGIFNDWLRAHAGYGHCSSDPLGNCCLDWSRVPGNLELTFHVNRSDLGINPVSSVVLDHALRQGNPVVAGVHWGAFCRAGSSQTEDCHWVVLTGKAGTTYTIVDPYNPDATSPYGVRTTLDAGVHGAYIIDRFVIVEQGVVSSDASAAPASRAEQQAGSSLGVLLVVLALIAGLVFLVATSANDR